MAFTSYEAMPLDQMLNLLYHPVRNEFRGRTAIEAQISAINPIDGTQ